MAKDNRNRNRHRNRNKDDKKGKGKGLGLLYDPTALLAGKDLKKASKQLGKLETGPLLAQIKRELKRGKKQDKAQVGRTKEYYKDLGERSHQAVKTQGRIGDDLLGALAASQADAQGALSTSAAENAARMAQDSSLRGSGLEGGSGAALASEAQAQAARLAAQGQSASQYGANQSGAWQGLANAIAQSGQMQGAERVGQIEDTNRYERNTLKKEKKDLKREQGRATLAALLELRGSEAEMDLARAGLKLDKRGQALDAASEAEDQRLERLKAKIAKADSKQEKKRWQKEFALEKENIREDNRRADKGDKPTKEDKENDVEARKAIGNIQNAAADAKRLLNESPPKPTGKIRDALRKAEYTATEINAAMDLAIKGYLSPANVKALKNIGVRIPKRWKPGNYDANPPVGAT